jgi:hypothetical protein
MRPADPALIAEFVAQRHWAVVGASTDQEKYGYRVFRLLTDSGYWVDPINPQYGSIDGVTCYPSLAALPVRPAVVDLVVPPVVGLAIVRQCAALGIERLWCQPGAESPALLALAAEFGLKLVYDACAMVSRRRHWPAAGAPAQP